jgi:hypothetical protein
MCVCVCVCEGEYIGDMALLGQDDWAKSTCFELPPDEVDTSADVTEIKVTADRLSYVVALQVRS